MELTLDQAAVQMGKSVRQVRYMVQKGELPARRRGRRWYVDSDALPKSAGRGVADERKERELRGAVERALDIPEPRRPRYSARDLEAVQIALPLHQRCGEALGPEHPATRALHRVIDHLARGCHRYDYDRKAACYSAARDAASTAVCELLVTRHEAADAILADIEQDLMAALAGLLRRLARKQARRGPPEP